MTKKNEGRESGKNENYDFIIIGAGVAGLAAAMYGARLGMKTLCLGATHGSELPIGGVITTTNLVENYPGFIKISGPELAEKIKAHAESYELATIKEEKVEHVIKKEKEFAVISDKNKYLTKAILFATGTKWRALDVPGSKEFENKGIAYCALCQPPEEEIIANSNILEIGKVTPMTKVLTHEGNYQNIGGFARRKYEGKLISITPRFFTEAVNLTPEHPVLSLNVIKGVGANYYRDFKIKDVEWKEAQHLTKEDCVLYPLIKETQDVETIRLSDYLELRKYNNNVIPHKQTHTAKILKDEIIVNNDLMRLFGYYLAEGSTVKHEIRFYFNKNEKKYIDDVADIIKKSFGVDAHICDTKYNVRYVGLYSKVVADLFKVLFDKYAHSKKVPHFMLLLPIEKQIELIKGLWRGDGCTRKKDFCFVTVSRKLAYQVRDILLRLGIICSLQKISHEKLATRGGKIDGRDISFTKDKYHINVGGQFLDKMGEILEQRHPILDTRKFSNKHAWIHNGYAVLPIRKIEKRQYKGDVLSIGVDVASSYVTKSFIVHNCDAPLFRNKVIAVVGGSDSAAKDALVLAEHAKKVYMIYRREQIRAEPINLQRVLANKKIEIINNANVLEVKGDKSVKAVVLDREYNGSRELEVRGVFVAIGHLILSEIAQELGVKVNEKKEIIIDHKTSETNIKGVYAAGDVADKPFKQAITGVAEGCTAAWSAYMFLGKK